MEKFPRQSNGCREMIVLMGRFFLCMGLLVFGLGVFHIRSAGAFFSGDAEIGNSQFSTGYWIPHLEMQVAPDSPDGRGGWYGTSPCVTLYASVTDTASTEIYYRLDKGDGYQKYSGSCIKIPDGIWDFSAYAIYADNWKSNVAQKNFKVDTSLIEQGDVIINELMWMGSRGNPDDEWMELRNMTDKEIDLSNWSIMYGGKGKNGHIEIPHGYSIKANGYFLIIAEKLKDTAMHLSGDLGKDEGYAYVSGMNLSNNGESLVLMDEKKNTIDSVWKNKAWPAGWHGILLHMSMARNDIPGDGTEASDWHACKSARCSSDDYWRESGNFGTPGKENLDDGNSVMGKNDASKKEIPEELTADIVPPEESSNRGMKKDNDDAVEVPNESEKDNVAADAVGNEGASGLEDAAAPASDMEKSDKKKSLEIEDGEKVPDPEAKKKEALEGDLVPDDDVGT